MKSIKGMLSLLFCVGLWASFVQAGTQCVNPYTGSAQFERLKKLAGVWEGTLSPEKEGDQPQKVRVEYTVSSGGSILIEKLFPGTPSEMVTIYQDRGRKPMMTHYCMMHNQPQMALKSSDDHSMTFEFIKTPGINPRKDEHMHALTLNFPDDGTLVQSWTNYAKGKPAGTAVFTFTREK